MTYYDLFIAGEGERVEVGVVQQRVWFDVDG